MVFVATPSRKVDQQRAFMSTGSVTTLWKSHVRKGDLVRIVKRIPLPAFVDEDIGKIGVITSSTLDHGEKKNDWAVVLVDGQFQLHAKRNLELIDAQD